jgi:hypothetical protein
MVKFEGSASKLKLWTKRAGMPALCLLVTFFAVITQAPVAMGQGTTEFTLNTTSLDPDAVVPGGSSATTITLAPVNSFSGTVTLGCQVTSNQTTNTAANPVCSVSPVSVTPPATATATITTSLQTTTVGYSVTITAAGPTTTYSAPPLQLTVLAVTPQFTINVQNAVSPNSVPAGSGAEGTVLVNPINGYVIPAGGITLYCSSITPLVTIAPVCSFSYPGSTGSLTANANPLVATLTISTFGPVITGASARTQPFYALWLPLPLLGLAGVGAACGGKRSRKACGLLAMFVVSASLLLAPACSSTNTATTTTPNGTTPANTYTFTIVGVDSNGVISSNTGTNTSGPSVSLTVTAPPKTP